MTSSDISILATIEQALADSEPTWVTLPPTEIEPSDPVRHALENFDAGPMPAGRAATQWLQQSALSEYRLSRTRLYIVDGAIAGYYSLANAAVEVSQRDRKKRLELETRHGSLPATLVTWLAKDLHAKFDGTVLIAHAAAVAQRATLTQASVVLAVDPFDEATAKLWMSKYGFRKSSGGSNRLWIPLAADG